jgi:hypothetical protein
MPLDLDTAYLLGGKLRRFLGTTENKRTSGKRIDAYLRDIAPGEIQIRIAIAWLSDSTWIERIGLLEGSVQQRMALNEISRDLASVFSKEVTRLTLAALAGYIEMNNDNLEGAIDSLTSALSSPGPDRSEQSPLPEDESYYGPEEAKSLLPALSTSPLVCDSLLDMIRSAGEEVSKKELVALCGYFKVLDDGSLRLSYTGFYESLLFAKYKSLHPASSLMSFPVRVSGEEPICINMATLSQNKIQEGFYSVSSVQLPNEKRKSIVLRLVEDGEMEEFNRLFPAF